MPEEIKKWITVNGKHIPLNESGEPITETGKKTLGKETDTSEAAKPEAETAQAELQAAQTEPQEKKSEPDAEKATEQTEKPENEAEKKDGAEPETGNTVTKSDGLTYSKTLAQYREENNNDSEKAARAFFMEQLLGKSVARDIGGKKQEIFFTARSWRKISHNMRDDPIKAEIVPHIPDIIFSGEYKQNPLHKKRSDGITAFHEFRKIVHTSDGDLDVFVDAAERPSSPQSPYAYNLTRQGRNNYENRLKYEAEKMSSHLRPDSGEKTSNDSVVTKIITNSAENGNQNNKNASGALMSRQNAAGPEASNDNVVNQIIHDAAQNARGESYLEVISIRFADEPIETEAEDMPRDRPRSDVMAFDVKSSRRHKDGNGYLHVEASNITKEQVAPYYGDEIPEWRELGLEPRKLYYMYRPADELEKAVDTFNGMPLLFEHHQINAAVTPKEYVIGSLGTDAEFRAPYVVNSLIITDGEAIDAIERGEYKELSAAYVYTPVMRGGIFNGEKYDGKMTDIKANHVALVKEGRAGPDVAVADSKPETISEAEEPQRRKTHMENNMVDLALLMKAIEACKAKREAKDCDFSGVVDEMFPDKEDAAKEAIATMLEALAPQPAPEEDEDEPELPKQEAQDEPDEEMRKAMDECGVDGDDPKAAEAFMAGVKYGESLSGGKDEEAGPEKAADEEEEDKEAAAAAMDAKLRSARDEAIAETKAHFKALYAAAQDCRPVLGNLVDPMAFDSAADIYRKALRARGVDTRGVHTSAFPAMLKMALRDMTRKPEPAVAVAADSAPDETMKAAAAGLARIQH